MYADDLVLISESSSGLQRSLDLLHGYCKKWKLNINFDKTNVIIFNKGGHRFKTFKFHYDNKPIDFEQSYCYLGIVFNSCGSFKNATKLLKDKAGRAMFALKQKIFDGNIDQGLRLFDSHISPILLYCSEIWSPYFLKGLNNSNIIQLCDKTLFEKTPLKFYKFLLGVNYNSVFILEGAH